MLICFLIKKRTFSLCNSRFYLQVLVLLSYTEKHQIQLFGRGHIGGIDIKVNISFKNSWGILLTTELDCSEKCSKSCMNKQATDAGADQGFFLGEVASLRNGLTDWWRKQILKANTKKKAFAGFWLGNNIMWTAENTYQTVQQNWDKLPFLGRLT